MKKMKLDSEMRVRCRAMVALLDRIPDGDTWVDFSEDNLCFQAETQDQVRRIRAWFPGAIWQKTARPDHGWWEYTATVEGVPLKIYAVREAPPTCRAIEETVEVEESVPVTFETRKVTRKVLRWECDEASA